MPTLKPRVQVTLEPETHAIIERFAQLQGCSRGAVISSLLESAAPSLVRTVALLEAAFEAPNQVKRGLVTAIEGMQSELSNAAGDASRQLDFILSRAAEAESNPHVVTRGSGLISAPTKTRSKGSRKGISSRD